MRTLTGDPDAACGLLVAVPLADGPAPGDGPEAAGRGRPDADDLVARMMAFDKDKDGKLTKAEVTDERLLRLFDRADADKDGIVTKEELTALAAREPAERPRRPGGFGGPGGSGRRPGGGPGGFDGWAAPAGRGPAGDAPAAARAHRRAEDAGRRPPEGGRRQAREDPQRRAEGPAQGDAGPRPRRLRPSRRLRARRPPVARAAGTAARRPGWRRDPRLRAGPVETDRRPAARMAVGLRRPTGRLESGFEELGELSERPLRDD